MSYTPGSYTTWWTFQNRAAFEYSRIIYGQTNEDILPWVDYIQGDLINISPADPVDILSIGY